MGYQCYQRLADITDTAGWRAGLTSVADQEGARIVKLDATDSTAPSARTSAG